MAFHSAVLQTSSTSNYTKTQVGHTMKRKTYVYIGGHIVDVIEKEIKYVYECYNCIIYKDICIS